METLTLLFMFLNVGVGLLIVGLSVPLIRRRIRPNRWYGFRTPKTISSERIWYEANAYAGQMLLWAGVIFIAAAIVLYFVFRANFVGYNVACAVVASGAMLIAAWLSFRHLRSL
jgi:uncharacterized membrane protein